MIHIAVVEDDQGYREELAAYLKKYGQETGEKFCIKEFSDGDEIVENYKGQYDIILMDIEMEFMDGMTAAEQIRRTDSRVIIIFITNMSQYAIRGYAVDALDYVLKPLSYFAFSQKIRKAVGRIKKREESYLTINTKNGIYRIPVSEVFWLESQGHRITYHTERGDYETTTCTMKKAEEMLRDKSFVRCNNCYLVNLAYVTGMEKNYVILRDGWIEVSRSRKNSLKKALTEYMGE